MQRLRKPPATIALLAMTALLFACGSEASIDATADEAPSSPAGLSAGSTNPPSPSSTTPPDSATPATAGSVTAPAVPAATTASTTQWTPPSITWPTTPYTLPADYGAGGPVCDPAPPRPTDPPGAALPTMEWTIDDTFTLGFDPPDEFQADPLPLPAVNDCDRANGLYLLERWFVEGEPAFAGMTVQANPGNDSPLLSRTEFSDSIVGSGVTWYLWNGETVRQTGKPPNMGLAVLGDYLVMIHGSPEAMRAIVENLTIQMMP